MSSLTSCLKKAGTALNPQDKAAVLAKSRQYRADGMAANDAAKKAIAEQIEVVRALIAAEQAPVLKAPTRAEILAKQEAEAKAKADKEKADRAAKNQAAEDEDRKRIAQASVAAADTFELGGNALDNLTGQKDIFGAPAAPESQEAKDRAKAQADLDAALGDLGDIFGKNFRATMMPEQETKLLPVMVKLFDAAFRLGYYKFMDAAKFTLDKIRAALGNDVADAITLEHLQGAYISMSSGKTGVDNIRVVSGVQAKSEIERHAAQVQQNPKEPTNANPAQTQSVPQRDTSQAQKNDTAGNRDSQPMGAGVAETGASIDSGKPVPGGTEQPRAAGTGGAEQAGTEPSSQARDSAGVRPESSSADDFVIDAGDIGKGGLAKKYRENIAAIRLLKTLETEGRVATPEERKALAKYVGWGALKGPFDPENKQWAKEHEELTALLTPEEFRAARKSTLDAHYTSPVAVGAMFDAVQRLGFSGGRILEPSVGSGNFFGLMPREMRSASNLHGVELDSLTSRLVSALYPKAKIAKATGFEDFDIPSEYFDLMIGNPPFGSQPLVDKDRSAYSGLSIHNYFLAKGIDKLRPGGIMQVIVSHNFLDAQDDRARKWIGERANLISAVRLPNSAFKENAGTEVVTDILIFQKKTAAEYQNGIDNNKAPWQKVIGQVNTNPKTGESVTHKVNEFFATNSFFVLGTPSAGGSMYAANEYTVQASGDLKEQLAKWVKSLPKDIYDHIDRKADAAVVDMAVPDGLKVGSFYVDASGKVMQRGADVLGDKTALPWVPKTKSATKRMVGMIGLRDSLRKQMRLERSLDSSESEIEANRAELNRLYDDFLKKFGHLNNQTNRKVFLDDTESQLLQALEFDFDKGVSKATAEKEGIDERDASAVKADILKRRVAFPPQDFLTVKTAKDALLASLNYRGKVDSVYMAEVYGKSMDEIVRELGDVVYDDPQKGVITADEYLSGDVKTKLAEAKAAAQAEPKYRRNVDALEKVIPKDKKPSEISVSIGAAFVPPDLYQQFVKHISGGSATAAYIRATGQWAVSFTGGSDAALNTGKFGTSELSAQELFQLAMLGRGAVVKKTIRNADGTTSTVVKEKETEAAREKQNAIKAEWQKWLWGDAKRADEMAALYNEKMNRIVDRKFDGQHLSFPGMNPAITLLEHQKNGVWRGLQSYQVLYDHVVGAGKTFEMATLAMEMRRLGISRKPLFVVPNHLTLQWRSEFTRLYPGSNILAATPEDFAADRRERMFSKIITGDWDAVVIGHSSLKKIGLPEETEKAVLQEQVDEVTAAIEEMKRGRGDRNIIRDMEKIRGNLEAKMKEKLTAVGKRSKVVTFDELGIDAMFIDEMHEFKNLAYNSTMDRNPGMGNPNGSAKAFDLFVKTRWMFDTFGEKTPYITATGTPVSNSLVEMFNMQRYVQYPTLKKEGLHVFDAWAKQFGNVESVYEVAPSGAGYRQSTRFSKFSNLPSLMGLYNTFADTITLDDLRAQEEAQGKRFPVPKMVSGRPVLVVAKRSPAVAALMGVPKAETNEDGSIKFELDLNTDISITQDANSKKFVAKSDDVVIGSFDTEEDARLKIAERALTPKVTVSPLSILGRFANLRELTKESKGKINALSLTGEANKAGLDYRLIDPEAADFPGSKINLAVENMVKVYKQWTEDKGAQLVFCDMSIPLSARASYSSKERRLYVRDENGAIEMKRGTMHTVQGFESLPYFIVQKGTKDAKTFDIYDAASGVKIGTRGTKSDAKDSAGAILGDQANRQRWIDKREAAGEIAQEQVDEYNNDNDVETENSEAFTREDIAGVSGAAAFSVYDDIKAKLIAKGIPEREIAFIHDYSTPSAKDKLFKAVNAGEIRFLLGSTPKMGAGTNVQKRLVGLHHIDAPWRPSDLEQREGRIIRRGNSLYERDPDGFEVFIGRYATEQTYDTRRWQILEHKARGIEQLRNFDGTVNEIDDIEGEAANSADMKAAASGDPMILEETKLRNEVRRLERLQAAHADEVLAMTRKARDNEQYAEKFGVMQLQEVDDLIGMVEKNPVDKEGWSNVTVDGKVYKNKEAASEAIAKATSVVRAGMTPETVVEYRGLTFKFLTLGATLQADSPTGSLGVWAAAEAFSGSGFITRMVNYAGRLPASKADITAKIDRAGQDAVALREQAKQPFAQAGDLDKAREDYKKVQRALLSKGPDVPQNQKAAVAQGIKDQRATLEEMGYGSAVREFFGNANGQRAEEDGAAFSRDRLANAFSLGITPRPFMAVTEIQKAVDELTAKWVNGPKTKVVKSPADLPIPAPADARGLIYNGTAYIVAANHINRADVARTLAHEAIGHYGLWKILGPEGTRKFERNLQLALKSGNKPLNAIAAKVREIYVDEDGNFNLSPAQEANEIAAFAVEAALDVDGNFKPGFGFMKEVFAKIAQFLRDIGINVEFTNLELQGMLVAAARNLEAGARLDGGGRVAVAGNMFGRADQAGTPATQTQLPNTITVDGKERPTKNNLGQPIHPTEEGVRNFWRWFGDSKVVGKDGRPMVMYHGTSEDFDAFDMRKGGSGTLAKDAKGVAFFTTSTDVAEDFAGYLYVNDDGKVVKRYSPKANIMPVYLRVTDPTVWSMSGGSYTEEFMASAIKEARKEKADGIAFTNMADGSVSTVGPWKRSHVIAVFKSTQIKSAIGNNGDFDPKNPNIAFARGGNLFQQPTWVMPGETNLDKAIYEAQDGRIDLKRAQQAIEKTSQKIEEKWDARLAETLYPGRVAHRSKQFLDTEVQPLLKALAVYRVPMDELADYLHARGAQERNKQVAKVNDNMPDGGAGKNTKGVLMTNQAAKDYLAAIPPGRQKILDALARRVDAITAGTRDLLVAEGLEKQETIDAWTATYKNYVPMFRDEAESGAPHPQGAGFSVRGSASKRAMGSTKEVTNILAHVLMQREAAITRAEKNRVAVSLYGLALSHPNPEFWTTIRPNMTAAKIGAELQSMGVDPATAIVGMERAPTIATIDPNTGKVVNRPNPLYKSLPGAIPLKVKGEDRVLMINVTDPRGARMAENLKNLDGLTQLDLANTIVGKSTRWVASTNTQYNPAFGLVNVTRDTLGGVVNLGSTALRGNALKVLAKTPVAIVGIARELASGNQSGKWQTLYRQFQADGGQTGFKENFRDAGDRTKAIEAELKALGRSKLDPRRGLTLALDLLDGFNTTLENAVRLSAYAAALDKGISRAEAARLARELTVDFNRKGRLGREMGPLYAFFNASVQGGARTIETLAGPTGRAVIAGGLGLGVLQAIMLAAAGYDDDEIPEWVKTRALIIPLFDNDKRYVAIPYPLGLHVIPNTGRVMTELALNGGKNINKRTFDAVGELAGAFNPLGGGNIFTADGALKTIAPTLVDPIIELGFNKTFSGGTISKPSYGGESDNRPGAARIKEGTLRSTTGQAYLEMSKAVNALTGGTDYEAGKISPTPEQLRYIAQTVGGGVLREIEKAINASTADRYGKEVPPSQIPVLGRFYGEVNAEQNIQRRYYDTAKELKQLDGSIKAMEKAGDFEAADAFEAANPKLELVRQYHRIQTAIIKLNKEAVQVINDPKEAAAIDQERIDLMADLNDAVDELEKETGKPTLGDKIKGWRKQ